MRTGQWERVANGVGTPLGRPGIRRQSICVIIQAAWRQQSAQHGDQGVYILLRKRISLGGCPKRSTFGNSNKANSQGHMVLTLSFLWATFWVAMHNPNFYHLRPQILERLLGFSSAPRSFSSINNCVRGYNSLLHLSCHRTLLKLESCSF